MLHSFKIKDGRIRARVFYQEVDKLKEGKLIHTDTRGIPNVIHSGTNTCLIKSSEGTSVGQEAVMYCVGKLTC